MKEIRIFEQNGGMKITYNGMNVMELLGTLRFYEKQVWLQMNEGFRKNTQVSQRATIADFINKKSASVRLNHSLHEYCKVYETNFIDEIDRTKFLRLRNTGMKTWKEFEKINSVK